MKKTITIELWDNGDTTFKFTEGMPVFEVLGALRFYEKEMWLRMTNSKQEKKKTQTK